MRQPGFTLTKFTVALALLALLAVAIFIFADPAGRIGSADGESGAVAHDRSVCTSWERKNDRNAVLGG